MADLRAQEVARLGKTLSSTWRNPDGTLKKPRRSGLLEDPRRKSAALNTYRKNVRGSSRSNTIPSSVGTAIDDQTALISKTETVTVEKWELCRKISYAIVTQDAAYELPPGWDDTETSPTWPDNLPDPADPWNRQERVHEIVYITKEKEITREKFYIPLLPRPGYGGVFSAELSLVINDGNNNHVPYASRIDSTLLNSTEAQKAIQDAGNEI